LSAETAPRSEGSSAAAAVRVPPFHACREGVIAMVVSGAVLVVLAVVIKSGVVAALAGLTFLGVLAVVIAEAVPSLRYTQSVKYDHSFLTNLMGETSRAHPGPGAKTEQPPD
jgi:hypothetical protein